MILFVTFLWNGRSSVNFKAEYALGLKRMAEKHLTVPHRFVCVTSPEFATPLAHLGVETFPLWPAPTTTHRHALNCLVRLGLLGAPGGELATRFACDRFVQVDLDTIISGNIDHLARDVLEHDFKGFMTTDVGKMGIVNDRGELRGYQGALWGGRLGAHPHVWSAANDQATVTAATKTYVGTDQAVLTYTLPHAPTWSEADGISLKGNNERAVLHMFCGTDDSKPWGNPHFKELYYRESGLPRDTYRPYAPEPNGSRAARLRLRPHL